MNTFYNELEQRGLIKQSTSPIFESKLNQNQKFTLYAGFDPTADSLHVGHMLPLLMLKRFQLQGHKVIAVIGGATGMIGDPSGKSQERSLQTEEQIRKNEAGISKIIHSILDSKSAVITNNIEWFKEMNFIDFLRDVGKHFSVNMMMGKDSVKQRLEDRDQGISYTEFSYMLLQAYDFYQLNKIHGCNLQIGGSDQWGNITAGIDLIRRMNFSETNSNQVQTDRKIEVMQGTEQTFGFTMPLVMKSDGTKFGKTESGAIWLSADKTSVYDFYQFFVQTSDQDVMTYLKYFSFLPLAEIESLATALKTAPEKREAQKKLAEEITRMVHGDAALATVLQASQSLFSADITKLDRQSMENNFKSAPSLSIEKNLFTTGVSLLDLLVDSGLCASKGAAKKDIQGGGIYLNNEKVTDLQLNITTLNLIDDYAVLIRKGKKSYCLIKVV